MGFQVENTECGIHCLKGFQQAGAKVDHEERKLSGIGHGHFFDVHKITQAPVLFGVAKIELNLESQAVKVNDFSRSQFQIGGEQNDVGLRFGGQISFEYHDDVEGEGEFFVEQSRLINLG